MLRHLTELGFKTWASKVKNVLETHNLHEIYEDDYVSEEVQNRTLVKLKEQFIKVLQSHV